MEMNKRFAGRSYERDEPPLLAFLLTGVFLCRKSTWETGND
jgi:hypothetical protein